MQVRVEMVRDFVSMLAKNKCNLYDVRFKMLRNKIKRERRSVNEQNVSNNLPSR